MLITLLALLTVVAWIADVPRSLAMGTTAILLLVSVALALNKTIKVSLHTGFSVFVACVLLSMQPLLALFAFALAIAVAWSRVVLRRHTMREVMMGGALGLAVGGVYVSALHLHG
jgi:membrane-associated phospholipid phosphatase